MQPIKFRSVKPVRYSVYAGLMLMMILLLGFTNMNPTYAQTAITPTPSPEPIVAIWDGQSRLNLLISGLDRRPGEGDSLFFRTDAIMVMSLDPATQSIGILNIPRGLFFALPPDANGNPQPLERINTLLVQGEMTQEGYGVYYMMDTLQYNLGMYIHAYVLFDFEAFIDIVDAIGGITITIPYDINDSTFPDMNFGYDPFYLRAGTHQLDGLTTLKFARTRHGSNDYLRGQRQLQVMKAIGERATSPEVLPSLLLQAPSLLNDLQGKLYTDLTLNDGISIATFAATIPLNNVRAASLNEEYLTFVVQDGSSIPTPDRTKLADLLSEVFGVGYNQ